MSAAQLGTAAVRALAPYVIGKPISELARELGLRILGDVKSIDAGPSAGLSWVYVMAPWGSQLEFVSHADDWPPPS